MKLRKLVAMATSRTFIADTLAMIVFSIILGSFIEMAIARMTIWQCINSRGASIPINMLTGGWNGKYRNWWVYRVLKVDIEKPSIIRVAIGDIISFVTFQVPLYSLVLGLSGASIEQIALACPSATILFVLLGKPYGMTLALFRRLLKAPC